MNVVSTTVSIGLLLCVVLGAVYLRIWFGQRKRPAYLFFSISAFATAAYAGSELRMMHAATVDQYLFALNWGHLVAWASYISFMLFVWHYLGASRSWIFWTGAIIRTVYLVVNFISPVNANFSEIPVLKQVVFLDETLTVAVGARNPFMLLGHIGSAWILIYCIDTAITVWRRGEGRMARWVGGSAVVFIGGRLVDTVLVMWGFVQAPLTVTPFFSGLLIAMGYKLTLDVIKLSEITEQLELEQNETRDALKGLEIAKEVGNLGVWVRDIGKEEFWASSEWRELFGFTKDETLTFAKLLARIHPDDQLLIATKVETVIKGSGNYSSEYRIVLPDGEVRWISSRGRLESIDGVPRKIFGASADITERKRTEEAVHDLGSRLIGAQESERARVGRELHDDLSQRLALLSIELERLHTIDRAAIDERIDQLSESIQVISSDVHRLSRELHPAKLDQLGLAVALRGFCRETAEARGLHVEIECGEIPDDLSRDISLCAYRIVQEAVQNVAKHSGADSAVAKIGVSDGRLEIEVSDKGKGFDVDNGTLKASLGLIGMRERVMSVDGKLRVDSKIGKGTKISATIPLSKKQSAAT